MEYGMNERIREIAEAADFYVGNEHYDKSREEQSRLLMQRFAELIAYECMDLALGSSHREDDMGAIIANKIKKHFGVTE
jgi:hypothetical protein